MNPLRRLFTLFSWACVALLLLSCGVPHSTPTDLSQMKSPEELAEASKKAYETGKNAPEKKTRLELASSGLAYAGKCLKTSPESVPCLYYEALNTGLFVQNHITNFQRGLKTMITDCETVAKIQADYESGGCYRIMGNIYSQAPSFSFNPKHITQDLDKSVEYLQKAVALAPTYPLNQLFLARSLEASGKKDEAKNHLQEFDRLPHTGLDSEYADWNKDRESLARKLL